MLAQDRLTAAQAAGILQQMLPAASLQLLQDKLGIEGDVISTGPRRAMSDPMGGRRGSPPWSQAPNAEAVAAMQAMQGGSNVEGNGGPGARASLESSRSSFDTARFSLDGNRMSLEYVTPPRDSYEYLASSAPFAQQQQAYLPPAPAFPQVSTMISCFLLSSSLCVLPVSLYYFIDPGSLWLFPSCDSILDIPRLLCCLLFIARPHFTFTAAGKL
jgi:hypothetical protein